MLKNKFILIILIEILVSKSSVSGCKADWDSTCKTNGDCCSGFCENNNGQWLLGICKPKPITTKMPDTTFKMITMNPYCKEDWTDDCSQSSECCSMICEIKANWMKGFCRPNVTLATTKKWGCLKDWDDGCEKDDDCCSRKCDKQNDGKWDYGVCQPFNTPKSITTKQTRPTTTTTTKIYNYRGTPESPSFSKPTSKSTAKSTTMKSSYYTQSKSTTKSKYLTQTKNKVTIKDEKLACECVCKNSLGQTCNQG